MIASGSDSENKSAKLPWLIIEEVATGRDDESIRMDDSTCVGRLTTTMMAVIMDMRNKNRTTATATQVTLRLSLMTRVATEPRGLLDQMGSLLDTTTSSAMATSAMVEEVREESGAGWCPARPALVSRAIILLLLLVE